MVVLVLHHMLYIHQMSEQIYEKKRKWLHMYLKSFSVHACAPQLVIPDINVFQAGWEFWQRLDVIVSQKEILELRQWTQSILIHTANLVSTQVNPLQLIWEQWPKVQHSIWRTFLTFLRLFLGNCIICACISFSSSFYPIAHLFSFEIHLWDDQEV